MSLHIQRDRLLAHALNGILIVLLVGAGLAPIGAVSGQEYYNNTTAVDNESWLEGNEDPTAENTTSLIGRVGSFIIGSDTGSALGALLTSVITGGMVVSMIGGSRLGMVGGATTGVLTLGGMTAAGLAPTWMWALVIFGVGLVLTQVIIGILR